MIICGTLLVTKHKKKETIRDLAQDYHIVKPQLPSLSTEHGNYTVAIQQKISHVCILET
jgi:hypothetical protein